MIQMTKKVGMACCGIFLVTFLFPPHIFAFPVQRALPKNDIRNLKIEKAEPYHETRPLSEIWDTAREGEEAFTFFHEIPATASSDKLSRHILLTVFPKITSGLLVVGKGGKSKPVFGGAGFRYPPLVSYEDDKITLFQLLQSGHRACEITVTVQKGAIITGKESAGCADYESEGRLLSKMLIGATILPPVKKPNEVKKG